MKLYLAVTPDKFELPLIVCDSARELAKKLNMNVDTVHSCISRKKSGKTSGRKLIKVIVDDEEGDY